MSRESPGSTDQSGGTSSSSGASAGVGGTASANVGGFTASTGVGGTASAGVAGAQGAGSAGASTGVECPGAFIPGDAGTCAPGEVCVSFLWSCNSVKSCASFETGSCEPTVTRVCGCDGAVYENECAAYAALTDLDGSSLGCAAPTGTFSCGYTFCELGEEFCVEHYEAGWECEPLPESCKGADPSCDCAEGGSAGAGGEGGSAGEGEVVRSPWGPLTDARCNVCVEDGPGLKINCAPF